jgi:hypothetical protein
MQHPLPFSLAAHPYSTCHVVKKKGCAALLSKKKNSLFPIRTSVLPPCHVVATLRGSIVNATVPCQTTILQHLQEHGFFSHNHPLYYMLHILLAVALFAWLISHCSLGLSATSQQYFSLTTNQPQATQQTRHQYSCLRTDQHQPSATEQTDFIVRPQSTQ